MERRVINLRDEAAPGAARDEELVATARRGPRLGDRTGALKALLRRNSRVARPLTVELITDRKAPSELRTIAATALAEEATAENQALLLTALASDDPDLVRMAAKGLGRIGDRAAVEALAAVEQRLTRTYRDVAFARTLISYRLGFGVARLKPPPPADVLEVDRSTAVPVESERVEAALVREVAPELRRQLPAIRLADTASTRFACGDERQWLIVTEDVAGARAASTFTQREHVAAVLLKESSCPGGWYIIEYLLTHPRGTNLAALFGVRPTGTLVHFGEIETDGPDARVRVRAANTPVVHAIDLQADYRGMEGEVVIAEGHLAPTSQADQRRPAVPRQETARTPRMQ